MYSFVVTVNNSVVDFGTYHHKQCAIDTAKDSPFLKKEGAIYTIIKHDDDGSCEIGV